MRDLTNIKIAVDFDGTIVEHEYPAIGKEVLFAFITLKELAEERCAAHTLDIPHREGAEGGCRLLQAERH
ncbi:MAG: hypothetical protein MZV63_53565 [Marinilabiliales bacterium]|nr:hypothetical protein [Marinilabiliales bacterium]